MKAGPREQLEPKSISPLEICDVNGEDKVDSDADEEGLEGEPTGEACERVALEPEGAVVKRMVDPKLPSEKEVQDHWLEGHVRYRNWCDVCIKARGKEVDHQRDKREERKLPEYSFDYCFPGDEFGFKWAVLVGKERMS